VFAAKSSLNRHQKTAKYCLTLQGKVAVVQFKCECGKNYTDRSNLVRHKKSCTFQEPKNDNTELMQMFSKTLETLENIAKTPTITKVNNTQNNINIAAITTEDLQSCVDAIDLKTILKGGTGYALLAANTAFNKNNLIIADKSRKKLRYKEENGELVEDLGGKKITKKFFTAIGPKNKEIIDNEYENVRQEFDEIKDGMRDGDMVKVLSHSTHLQDILHQSIEAAEGLDNELTDDFVKGLVQNLIKITNNPSF